MEKVLLFLVAAAAVRGQEDNRIVYRMAENNPAEFVLGNVATSAGLDQKYGIDVLPLLRFQFLAQSSRYAQYFSIGQQNGVLKATQSIDRDSLAECAGKQNCSIPLDISVQPGQYFTIIKVSVDIQDLNDNIPTFPSNQVTITVSEAADVGTRLVPVPLAVDPDSPTNSIKRYNIQGDISKFQLRVVTTGGVLTPELILLDKLDREVREFYQVTLEAADGGTPPQTGSVLINIHVRDVNDNIPIFDNQTYETSVLENIPKFTTIVTVRAVDIDAGLNGEVMYEFTPATKQLYGHLFGIDETTGDIFVKDIIDYEEAPRYALDITAKDKGEDPTPVLAKVIVNIRDVNDHAPRIRVNSLTDEGVVTVSENSVVGEFVAHITVLDPDGGENGRFNCSLDNAQQNFQLQQLYSTEFKIVTTAVFDREQVAAYDLALVCQDFGSPPQASTQIITVRILDVNDHSPVFSRQVYEAAVDENNAVGAWLLRITATDEDAGNNATIKYTISSNASSLFNINDAGNITAKVRLDHEVMKIQSFIVVATDQGTPPQSATALVRITVNDVDDNAPQFSEFTYVLNVTENQASPDTYVGQITASDPDDAPYNKFEFDLDPRYNTDNAFKIDPLSGKIYCRRALDREVRSVYHIVVTATSLGADNLVNRTNVFISVLDMNDNSPVIDFPSFVNNTVYMHADEGEGYVVTRIVAKDNDTSINSQLSYNITSGNEDRYFSVDQSTGAVLLTRRISITEDHMYTLTVRVWDHGTPPKWEETTLNIIVNKSAIADDAASLMSKQNLTIVVVIAAISGILMVILLLAIVYIVRKQRIDRRKKYNYMPRMVEQKLQTTEVPVNNKPNGIVRPMPSGKVHRQPSNNSSILKEPGAFNNSFDKNSEQLEYPSLQRSDGSNSVFMELGDGRHPTHRQPSMTSSTSTAPSWNLGRNVFPLETIPQSKVWVQGAQHPGGSRRSSDGDKDSDSQCSADMSNADSGRGSNDDGSDPPCRPTSPSGDPGSVPNTPIKVAGASTSSVTHSQPTIPTKSLSYGVHPPPYPPKRPLADSNHNNNRGHLDHPSSRSTADQPYSSHPQVPRRPPKGENLKMKQSNGGLYYASHV